MKPNLILALLNWIQALITAARLRCELFGPLRMAVEYPMNHGFRPLVHRIAGFCHRENNPYL